MLLFTLTIIKSLVFINVGQRNLSYSVLVFSREENYDKKSFKNKNFVTRKWSRNWHKKIGTYVSYSISYLKFFVKKWDILICKWKKSDLFSQTSVSFDMTVSTTTWQWRRCALRKIGMQARSHQKMRTKNKWKGKGGILRSTMSVG